MRRRTDYQYHLPPELIAQVPADRREGARLLVIGDLAGPSGQAGGHSDRRFADIVELLPANAVLVVNDTRVIPARLHTVKPTGGAVELLFLEQLASHDAAHPALHAASTASAAAGPHAGPEPSTERWRCLARANKGMRPGMVLTLAGGQGETITIVSERAEDSTIIVEVPGSAVELLERYGEVPLPPYITRPEGHTSADRERYQTVFARQPGAVAAPTAGLHFTQDILAALERRGVTLVPVTLHVGLGTFAPMRADDIDQHRMHRERYHIPAQSAAILDEAVRAGRPIAAVGTTSVRTLESAALRAAELGAGAVVLPGPGETELFIRPGFRFRVVQHLITNFHLPESTLLMLVCAFAGYDRVMAAYRHAVAAGYRFFSYGDACLMSRAPSDPYSSDSASASHDAPSDAS